MSQEIKSEVRDEMSSTRKAGWTLLCLCIFVVAGCMHPRIEGVIDTATYPDQKLYRIWIDTVADSTKPGIPDSERAEFCFSSKLGTSVVDLKIQELIRKEMKKLGFVEKKGPAFAQVVYVYAVEPREYIASSPDVVFGGQQVYSGRKYYRQLAIGIFCEVFERLEPNAPPVWQAELHSTGYSSDMIGLAEFFIPEMFKYYGQAVHNKEFTIPTISK